MTFRPCGIFCVRICGSYEALSGGLASEAMTDFSGGVVERFDFKEELPDNMYQILLKAKERRSLMSCAIDVNSNFVLYHVSHFCFLNMISSTG